MTDEIKDNKTSVTERLQQIEAAFDDENMCLDDALDFFEEAVELGMDIAKRTEENLSQGA